MTTAEQLLLIGDFLRKHHKVPPSAPAVIPDDLAKTLAEVTMTKTAEVINALGCIIAIKQDTATMESRKGVDLGRLCNAICHLKYVLGLIELIAGVPDTDDDVFMTIHNALMQLDSLDIKGITKLTLPAVRSLLQQQFPRKRLLFVDKT
jgi:hypothetical protein